MKKFFFFSLLILNCTASFFFLSSYAQTDQFFTDREKIKSSKIKSVTAWGRGYDYGVAREDSNKIAITLFDTSGNILELTNYYVTSLEDSFWEYSKRQFKYDSLGRRTETVQFDSENFPGYSMEQWIYSDSGLTLYSYLYTRWGDTNEKQLLKYDLKKNILEESYYDIEGTIQAQSYYSNEYDSNGKIISIINITDSTNIVCFEYDSCGSRTEQVEYWHDTIFSRYLWRYDSLDFLVEEKKQIKYYNVNERIIYYRDSIGNKIREDYCDLKNTDTCFKKATYAYDSMRKITEEAIYDTESNLVKKINWSYDSSSVLLEKKIFSPKEIGAGELVIRFDKQGFATEEIKAGTDKKLHYKIIYSYNEHQMPVSIFHLDKNERLLGNTTYIYEYFQ